MAQVPGDTRNPGPASAHAVITPSDTTNHTLGMARAVYIGGAGNLALVDPQGNAVTYTAVVPGTILQVCNIRVNSTGTTATALVALF